MKTLFRTLCVFSLVGMIASCGLLKKKDTGPDGGDDLDGSAEAAVAEVAEAAPPPVAAAPAVNENDISRFPDEKKLDNVTATIQRQTNVREIPGIGKVVAALAKGGTVTEIAQRSTFFLVVFDNPKDNKRLMGWINQDAFTAPADAGLKILTCTAPETPLFSDGPFCGRTCAADTDCPAGQACKGAANKFANAKLGDAVTVCVAFTPKPVPTPVTPASTQTVNPGRVVAPTCPAGQVFVAQDKACHQGPCRIGQCPATAPLCISCNGSTVCVPAGQRTLCK